MSERLTIKQGDCLTQLRGMLDESVQCIVTSPPYWGLRDYGVEGQIGLEADFEDYIAKIVEVFREARRVLRSDGTLWLNLGDCYNAYNANRGPANGANKNHHDCMVKLPTGYGLGAKSLKPKDLVGIPWRVALALQADGWYLRCDIVWHKPNPMPESVTDRPTKAHEYIFLMTKSDRYFYDAEAIRDAVTGNAHSRGDGVNPKAKTTSQDSRLFREKDPNHSTARKTKQNESFSAAVKGLVATRNKRSVWTVATAPYSEAHFATFPADLIKPCILAGTSAAGCCSRCGTPLERVIEKGAPDEAHRKACGADAHGGYQGKATKDFALAKAQDASAVKARILEGMRERRTVDWKPGCDCQASKVPCVVLDPFGGSGTTGAVALELGRAAVLIELNPDYVKLAESRCNVTAGLAL